MAVNPIVSGITATAGRLGMDPVDLATIISYETGGTFDPTQAGPTTQWGQHRGLIQFGEPQAKQHGVNWDDPINSQLGPGGAIENYFLSSGWKPGMGILDAYSIVNAGGPGRYNASDTAAGGAPGTVSDKVTQQFGPHRAKATAFLGMAGDDPNAIAGANPAASPIITAEVLDKYGLAPEPESYRMKNTSDTPALYNFSSGPRQAIAQPGVQDIGMLANLVTPNRQVRAQNVLENLRAFS